MFKIIYIYNEFGLKYFLNRCVHKIVSLIGIRWESSYLLTQQINSSNVVKSLSHNKFNEEYQPRKLQYEDFRKGDKSEFTKSKLDIIQKRIQEPTHYIPYGIVHENLLIYSCWINLKEFEFSFGVRKPMNEDALFEDDYCHPDYRGKGIHTFMNFYRLNELSKKGLKSAAVLIHTYNTPAIKSQIKAGFKTKSKILVIKFFNKIFVKERISK